MNKVFELIILMGVTCIFLVFIVVMIIFIALRNMQKDINVIYSRTYTVPSSLDLIETLIRRLDAKVSAITEAYEQGKKDARMWTPIAEDRPPLKTPVLTCDFTGDRSIVSLVKRDGVYRWQAAVGLRPYEEITAWQELPEPYVEEKHTEDSCSVSYEDV